MKLPTAAVAVLVSSAADAASSPMQATVRASSHNDATFRMFSLDGNHHSNKIRQLLPARQEQLQHQRRARATGKGLFPDVGRRQPVNNKNNTNNALRSAFTECSPDLGILACGGLNEYCIASMESTFGGYCVDMSDRQRGSRKAMRFLQEEPTMMPMDEVSSSTSYSSSSTNTNTYCSCPGPSYNATNQWERAYYYYCKRDPTYSYQDCTCSNVDREQYTLLAQCTSKPREGCYTAYSNCGANYTKCYDDDDFRNSLTLDITDEGSFSSERCYQKEGMEFCSGRSISFTPSTPENPYGIYSINSCSRKVNGVTCNSCEAVTSLYDGHCAQPLYVDNPDYICTPFNRTCYEFDCENTEWKRKGSSCDPYTYEYDIRGYGCDLECKICGADATMTLPDAVLTIPFYWTKMTCGESQRRAEQGSLTSDGCAAMNLLASEICGCEATDGSSPQSDTPKEEKKDKGKGIRKSSAEAVLAPEDTISVPAGANLVATGLAVTVATATAWLVATVAY